MSHLHETLQLEPDNLELLIFTASVQAANENQHIRDGLEARVLAEKAGNLTGGHQPSALDTLAMACAESGQFDQAMQIRQQAVKLIMATGQKDDLAPMQQRLQLYESHQPWRESFNNN